MVWTIRANKPTASPFVFKRVIYKISQFYILVQTPWPNGKALLSGGKDWEFESPRCRILYLIFWFLRDPEYLADNPFLAGTLYGRVYGYGD